jgi:hypothetical protein
MRADDLEKTERELLVEAKKLLPIIPFSAIDLLIVDQMGKDISGTGMDQNIIARTCVPFFQVPDTPKILRIFVRNFSPEADGNAIGLGNADFTTTRLVEKINREATYMNGLTANTPENLRVPPYFNTDREAVETALTTIGNTRPEKARIVHILDTLRLQEMVVSRSILDQGPLPDHIEIVASALTLTFDEQGMLISDLSK